MSRSLTVRLLVALLLQAACLPLAAQDLTELARRARDSVVVLSVFDDLGREVGTGTGFFVDGGYLVTNHHVIAPARRVEARLAEAQPLAVAGVLAADVEHDLAVLKLESGSGPPLPLAQRAQVEPGEQIVVLGNPLGLSGTLSEGIVSAIRETGIEGGRDGFSGPLIQISAAISPGSSGSPVMSLEGEVVGVAMGQYLAGQNLNFAIPVSELRRVLRNVDPDRLVSAFGESRVSRSAAAYLRNLLISLVFFAAVYFGLRHLRKAESAG